MRADSTIHGLRPRTLVTSYRATHHHHKGTLIRRRAELPREREEDEAEEEELVERNEREIAMTRYDNPSSQFLFYFSLSLSLVVIYVKIFHCCLILHRAENFRARCWSPLAPSRSVLSFSLSRPAFPTRRKVPRARFARSEGGDRINFGR